MKTLISRRSFLKAAGVLGAAAALSACGGSNSSASAGASADGAVKLTMSLQDNTSSNYYQGALKIAECVEKATNGQITMTVQAGGTLGSEGDCLDMAIQGDLDIASCANSVLANYIPEMTILDQAFLWDTAAQANYAVTHELGELIQAKANALGLHVIGYLESGFRDVFATRAVDSMADFKGLKIRVMQNEGQLTAFTSFGANPIALSPPSSLPLCSRALSMPARTPFPTAGSTSITRQALHMSSTRITALFTFPCA